MNLLKRVTRPNTLNWPNTIKTAYANLLTRPLTHYKQLKYESICCDFNDLIDSAKSILKNEANRHYIQEHYRYIFVDESQDTNADQWELIDQPSTTIIREKVQALCRRRSIPIDLFVSRCGTRTLSVTHHQ